MYLMTLFTYLLFFSLPAGVGALFIYELWKSRVCSERTVAQVLAVERNRYAANYMVLQYVCDDTLYRKKINTMYCPTIVLPGDSIPILYYPQNPVKMKCEGKSFVLRYGVLFVICIFLFLYTVNGI